MKNIFYFLCIILISLLMFSCAKEGCTDPDAENYNSSATKSDGSCTFQGRVVFWYDEATSDSLYYFGSDFLIYTVDGEVVGTQEINTYLKVVPICGQSVSIAVTKDLGSNKTKSFNYSVVDDLGDEIWGGNLEFTGNTCWGHELVW